MANHFINMAQQYVNVNANSDDDEEEKKESGSWRNCGNRKGWSEKRAIFTKLPENNTVEGDPGQYVIVEVEVQNGTKWPWKRGCYFGIQKYCIW